MQNVKIKMQNCGKGDLVIRGSGTARIAVPGLSSRQ